MAVTFQIDATQAAGSNPHQRLRAACDEFVGMAMFGQFLRQARESSLNSDLLESPAQRMFQSQLDDVMTQRASGKLGSGLGEALYRHLAPALGPQAAPMTGLDVEG